MPTELFRCCTEGHTARVRELLMEVTTSAIKQLYQGGSSLLYKYAMIVVDAVFLCKNCQRMEWLYIPKNTVEGFNFFKLRLKITHENTNFSFPYLSPSLFFSSRKHSRTRNEFFFLQFQIYFRHLIYHFNYFYYFLDILDTTLKLV